MLKEKKLPHTLWGKAVAVATYMLNMCPTKKQKKNVPFEIWTDDKQNVGHFRVFGSVCYKHVPGSTRKKLDHRSKVMLLIGYHSTCVYKLYCRVTNKVEFNRYIVLKESEACNWNESQSNSRAMLTPELTSEEIYDSEGESASEGNSASKDDLKSDGDSESKDGSESDSNSESEEDSGGESDDDSDSGCNPTSDGGHAYESGLSEGRASEGGPTSEIRPQRIRQIPQRFAKFDMLQDTKIYYEGEVI